MELIGYSLAILMGVTLGIVGGGGSILTVPILVYIFQIEPVLATAYSLFIVGLTALFGGVTYLNKGEVDLKTGLVFAIPSFIGVFLTRSYIIPNIPEQLFEVANLTVTKPLAIMLIFAVLMVFASWSMIRTRNLPKPKKDLSAGLRRGLIAGEGLLVGTVTGLVGAGGGFLIIPALVILVGLPMRLAVGTSLFIIAAKSLLGFLGDLQHQPALDWVFLVQISALAVFGMSFGARIAGLIPEAALKKVFGYFVMIMGFLILGDQILRMLH